MTTAKGVETSVTTTNTNSPSQDNTNLDDQLPHFNHIIIEKLTILWWELDGDGALTNEESLGRGWGDEVLLAVSSWFKNAAPFLFGDCASFDLEVGNAL